MHDEKRPAGLAANPRAAGFTLLELMVVVAVVLVIASLAVPVFQGARLSANETAAIGTMRAILSSQSTVTATPAIDTDGDGAGEYGYFAELAGSAPTRVSLAGLPAAGAPGVDELTPSMLIAALGQVNASVIVRGGYVFQIWLPGPAVGFGGPVPGLAEDPGGGKAAGPFPNSNNAEVFWCAYGWPLDSARTGNLALFVNQEGTILQTRNRGAAAYSDVTGGPAFDAALSAPGDMSSPPQIGTPANDGNVWVPIE